MKTNWEIADISVEEIRNQYKISVIGNSNKLPNVAIVLNEVDKNKDGYAYSYSYTAESKKTFWQRIGFS